MFKRIKNLLDLSKYSVEELLNPMEKEIIDEPSVELYHLLATPEMIQKARAEKLLNSTPHMPYSMATIINMHEVDPFKEFENDPTEQSPDDTTLGNK